MTDNDPWDAIFRSQPSEPGAAPSAPATTATAPSDGEAPASRRAARESESRRGGGRGRGTAGGAPRRRRRWPWVVLGILSLLAGIAAAGAWYVWTNYEEQVREVLGWELPNDYAGTGNGTEVLVTIYSGEIGADVATSLVEQGVTMTFDAFYDLLLADDSIAFIPGTYRLQEEMSAQSALDALLDPANKVELSATVREGLRAGEVIEALSAGTGLPLADYEAAIADPSIYGIPDVAPNIEGYLFPATYTFEPNTTAEDHIRTLVDEMFSRLDAAGVAVEDRHTVLTKASLIQREARLADDFYRVSRVIENRLADGWRLEFDSSTQYGAGETGSVWSSGDALDADNPYNTYVIEGLPIGPIAAPGDVAIDAVLNPADGPWFFFVTVNLATGETKFSETIGQHEEGVAQLRAWCRASEENAAYCA
ncbi:endolytic transglycosylase MltG [Microcella humidisoli]|uniref:Endolytic murein transglycosylase n=1 Tax=Microcella humidisoli TaxID=2963406 RepID=A0ABY5FVP6_9MICO|nr:endolytic transglycosylase MltG [Microcella humidisoli]UTT62371.1 endolytic transglycosylase MltG [Microcella humidisoli]